MNRERLEEINQNLIKENDYPVLDGITNYDQFGKSGLKILWIMKEANQSKGQHQDDLRVFHRNVKGYARWRRTYKIIIKSTYGILHHLNFDDVPDESNISDVLNEIAFINVKKTGGGSSSNWTTIAEHYNKNKNLILEQITCIEPDIIINASRVEDLSNILAISEWRQVEAFKVAKAKNAIIIHAYHPNQRKFNHPKYFELITKSLALMNES